MEVKVNDESESGNSKAKNESKSRAPAALPSLDEGELSNIWWKWKWMSKVTDSENWKWKWRFCMAQEENELMCNESESENWKIKDRRWDESGGVDGTGYLVTYVYTSDTKINTQTYEDALYIYIYIVYMYAQKIVKK